MPKGLPSKQLMHPIAAAPSWTSKEPGSFSACSQSCCFIDLQSLAPSIRRSWKNVAPLLRVVSGCGSSSILGHG
jgi:hypothetical protein